MSQKSVKPIWSIDSKPVTKPSSLLEALAITLGDNHVTLTSILKLMVLKSLVFRPGMSQGPVLQLLSVLPLQQ